MTLSTLNPHQREAAEHTDGPLLIVAGAGAGKTKTLTHRICHIISTRKIAPNRILAVTFTNKAAREMRERVQILLSADGVSGTPFVATFHALGAFLLRNEAERMELPRSFTIADTSDTRTILRAAVKKAGFDTKEVDLKSVRNAISRHKNDMKTPADLEDEAGNNPFLSKVARIWKEYEALLKREKALDFDDLLTRTVQLLREHNDIREKYQTIWQYIHIDEYQDTNTVQYEIARLLSHSHKNICVVGDADQSIYGWRGAKMENLLHFERDHPGTKVVLLEQNYRSTQVILDAANAVIEKNAFRIPKNLFTENDTGEKIKVLEAYSESDEARQIIEEIAQLVRTGVSPEKIAVLYRTNFQSRALEEALLYAGVPYQVLGVKFFERKEVKDILSFLRAGGNPDSRADVSRVVNTPPRGIGKVTLEKMFLERETGEEQKLPARMREKIREFYATLADIRTFIATLPTSEAVKKAIERTGYEKHLKGAGDEALERLENIRELVTLAAKYDALPPGEGMERLLEDAALASDQDTLDTPGQGVRLMTVHASKGLEFPYVFIAGLEEGLFPHTGMGDDNGAERAEEERRLFYVAITRAEKKLFLSYAGLRTIFGSQEVHSPSSFLSDIDEALLERAGVHNESGFTGKTVYLDF